MKVKIIYTKEFPDDMHGETIKELLKDIGKNSGMKLVKWED